ncbi:hypothetical protein OGAPHI_001400 [Ogataea philodendri]|uniref:ethanolamine kinase n=2 Tax=Saccharomycotina TaxID=147537 RepID=A0A9P8PD57_9ASCO|nr:uncharacterized protein OGAPHI_001400 [Ogataea philodendri]KAH3669279.1 hypothetical protein OGAPHI_001400 [Ogataea philodendri]
MDSCPESAYCLISDGGLHFLPYREPKHSLRSPYYSFLANKTMSSLAASTTASQPNSGSDMESQSISSSISETMPDHHQLEIPSLLDTYSAHALYLPGIYVEPSDNGNHDEIKKMLAKIFPHWESESLISVKHLTGGITNMLLECTMYNKATDLHEKVLVRTYGRGTGLIIDRDREFVSHLVINSVNLAPPIHARFGNGLVYGFIEGRSLEYQELSNQVLYPLIAAKLGQWHQQVQVDAIEECLTTLRREFRGAKSETKSSDLWAVISNWIQILPEIEGIVKSCASNLDIRELKDTNASLGSILKAELDWLRSEVEHKSPFVACHCDLLSGNVIISEELSEKLEAGLSTADVEYYRTHNPISFIDYEYMIRAPRAFDISNHFMEWQGFDCDRTRIPQASKSNELLREWCASYLWLENTEKNRAPIDNLITEISLYYGLPGFYWGIWSGIQSGISLIDFDYSWYAGERIQEYWDWKRTFKKAPEERS